MHTLTLSFYVITGSVLTFQSKMTVKLACCRWCGHMARLWDSPTDPGYQRVHHHLLSCAVRSLCVADCERLNPPLPMSTINQPPLCSSSGLRLHLQILDWFFFLMCNIQLQQAYLMTNIRKSYSDNNQKYIRKFFLSEPIVHIHKRNELLVCVFE